jgi:hypothetical protein
MPCGTFAVPGLLPGTGMLAPVPGLPGPIETGGEMLPATPYTFTCFPWPRTTVAVLIIVLVFVTVLVALGTAPLIAVGAVATLAAVAATGRAAVALPVPAAGAGG